LAAAVSVKAMHAREQPCTGYDDGECDTLKLIVSSPTPYFHTVR
jgi:hypothetical protein